ncbi:MAG: hypothetical protein AABY16_04050 [Nanoarchaeota archaeon]
MRVGYPLNRNSKSIQFSNLKKIGYTPNRSSLSREFSKKKIPGDVVGNIAILKFDRLISLPAKKKFAVGYLHRNKSVTTVLEKVGKFSGRLRTLKTRWLAGLKTREALYRENGCEFRFNVDTCYFSPRLSEERKKIASVVKKSERVLVMFGGVAPFAIVIGKKLRSFKLSDHPPTHPKRREVINQNILGSVISVELGRACLPYALENVKRNKLLGIVKVFQGDVRRVIGPNRKVSGKFDRIVMARPNLENSFLDVAFRVSKHGTIIHYYGFYLEEEIGLLRNLIMDEAKKAGRKIKILGIVKAGDIGTRKWRFRVDIQIE